MVVVLVAARYQKILSWIKDVSYKDIESIDIIKQNQGQIYMYVKTTLSLQDIIYEFRKVIYKECFGAYVYELYGIYNGKIDFQHYLSCESKDRMKYYNTSLKDITDEEINKYL